MGKLDLKCLGQKGILQFEKGRLNLHLPWALISYDIEEAKRNKTEYVSRQVSAHSYYFDEAVGYRNFLMSRDKELRDSQEVEDRVSLDNFQDIIRWIKSAFFLTTPQNLTQQKVNSLLDEAYDAKVLSMVAETGAKFFREITPEGKPSVDYDIIDCEYYCKKIADAQQRVHNTVIRLANFIAAEHQMIFPTQPISTYVSFPKNLEDAIGFKFESI